MTTPSSADILRRMLKDRGGDPDRLSKVDALYATQIRYTCQLLDVVDEYADRPTAVLITAAIFVRLTDDGAAEAAARVRAAHAEYLRLQHAIPAPRRLT